MRFYLVDKIGDGTKDNPFRPNLFNIDFVSLEVNGKFLTGVNAFVEAEEVNNLHNFCIANELNYVDVLNWFVGDN